MLAIIGPSGCGKTTVLRQLHKEGLVYVNPTYTERPMRQDEETLEHEFVSSEEFDRLRNSGLFVEVIQAFGLKYRYAVPYLKGEGNKVPLLMLRAQFLPLLFKHYPDNVVYQIEAPITLARKWLKKRGDHELGTRLEQFHAEVEAGRKHADRVFINRDKSAEKLAAEVKKALKTDFNRL